MQGCHLSGGSSIFDAIVVGGELLLSSQVPNFIYMKLRKASVLCDMVLLVPRGLELGSKEGFNLTFLSLWLVQADVMTWPKHRAPELPTDPEYPSRT